MNRSQVIERVKQVKDRYQNSLMALANVVGLGIGFKETNGTLTDKIALIVNVSEKKPLSTLRSDDVVPAQIEDIVTDVQETGHFRPI